MRGRAGGGTGDGAHFGVLRGEEFDESLDMGAALLPEGLGQVDVRHVQDNGHLADGAPGLRVPNKVIARRSPDRLYLSLADLKKPGYYAAHRG